MPVIYDLNPDDPVEVLPKWMSARVWSAIRASGAKTIGELRAIPDEQFWRMPNVGKQTARQIRGIIGQLD